MPSLPSPSPLRRRPHCGNLIGLLLDTIHRGRASYHKRRDDAARRLPALRTAATSRRVPPPRCIPLDGVVKTVSCQSRRRDPIMKFGPVFRRRRFATLLGITVYTPAPDLAPNVSQTSARVRRRRIARRRAVALNRSRACTTRERKSFPYSSASIEYRFNLEGYFILHHDSGKYPFSRRDMRARLPG